MLITLRVTRVKVKRKWTVICMMKNGNLYTLMNHFGGIHFLLTLQIHL